MLGFVEASGDVLAINKPHTNKRAQSTAKRVCRAAGARCVPCAAGDARRAGYRCGRRVARCADCLRCDALRGGLVHSCDARDEMQCAARGLVAFARCRRRHAFDGGIFRVGWVAGGMGG